jgi:myo-inositol-1(or 4)-monophosphatase
MKNNNKLRAIAVTAAYAAGEKLLERYYRYERSDAKFKSFHEILTKSDLVSEEIIIEKIKQNFPDHRILSEEAGKIAGKSEYLWVIDPLDGTHNFSMHNPLWAVSIALFHKNQPVLGVVFAPALSELFLAEAGQGAWLNGKRIKVSAYNGEKTINTFCHGSKVRDMKKALKYYRYRKLHDLDCRQLGSASLELAYTACGRVESIVIPGANSWDVAAGALLVQEAKGRVTDFKNKNWGLKSSDMAASNSLVHKEVLRVINQK